MRFSFRKKTVAPHWVEALGWTPEEPLDFAPKSAPASTEDAAPAEPAAAMPTNVIALPAPPIEKPPVTTPVPTVREVLDSVEPEPVQDDAPEPLPTPANANRAPSLLALRLCIGLAQGLGLFILLQSRSLNLWPGSDAYLFAALSLALLFAPLVLLEALGEIEPRLLAAWTGIVAVTLAGLGLYHHWRAPDQLQGGFALAVLTALLLVIAQSLLRAGAHDGKPVARYRTYADTVWTLAARLLVWAVLTGIAWALIGSGNSLLNWLRGHYPALRLGVEPNLLILPLVGLASAAGFDITAAGSPLRRQMRAALVTCCTVALPMLVAVAVFTIATHLFIAPVSLAVALGLALLLVIALNAAYRDGQPRAQFLRLHEFAAAFLIVALMALAATALGIRVAAFGWTAGRVTAAAGILALGSYGALYTAAALISIGGGRWMQRIEGANIALAFVLAAGCLALATPLADPLRIAVAAQTRRLESGKVDPAAFDFAWLRKDGARFGQAALTALARSPRADVARDAAVTLTAAPGEDAPAASQIGANITVRTPGARLPNTLLQQDWSAGPAVPPCLTKPALACDAWFLDLDGDGANEILLVYGNDARWWASVMKQDRQGGWTAAATLHSPACRGALAAMRAGGVAPADPLSAWRDVLVAGMRLSPIPAPRADLPCPLFW